MQFKDAFPFCQRCGWKEEPRILHVHHKDRNRKNIATANLETLCPTCHVLEHFQRKDGIWSPDFAPGQLRFKGFASRAKPRS
jgi:5-methylcytosine-specific restriction endonuclease McrA